MARIMIVDDEPKIVELITDMLSPLEHQIMFAYSGEEALKKLEQETPDLILLDIMMPGIDGIEVCSKIKERSSTADIPVLMVTGKRDMESHLDAIYAEADGYIMKPFTMDDLLAKVKNALEGGREKESPGLPG